MSDKKSKKSLKHLAKNALLGIPTSIATGPLGFRTELDVDPKNTDNPRPARILFREKEDEAQGPSMPGTSIPLIAIGDIEHENRPIAESTSIAGQEEGEPEPPFTAPKENRKNATHGSRFIPGILKKGLDGFGPLKALLKKIPTVYADRKVRPRFPTLNPCSTDLSAGVRNKVTLLRSHITSLDAVFATPPNVRSELQRRDELIRKLGGIKDQLQLLSVEPGSQQLGDDNGENLLKVLEDLQEAIFDYQVRSRLGILLNVDKPEGQQMARRTSIVDQGSEQMDSGQNTFPLHVSSDGHLNSSFSPAAEAAVIKDFRYAKRAEYRHGNRGGCLKGTRGAILDEIELWTGDSGQPTVYWLNGLAGTGKTTISQTVAERAFADGRLGASFFCSRDFEDRRNLEFIFPTLAIQLARKYTEFRSIFVQLVQSDPDVVDESLCGQMDKLIVQPLVQSAISTVIVIDALDECKDEEPASAILSVLGQFVAKIPKVKFFVTGRPEPRVREGFRLPLLAAATDVFVLHEVESSRVNNDIRLFFIHSFSELKGRGRISDGWPTEEQLDLLCNRAGGLFIHAVATVRFIDLRNNNPKRQLDRLLKSPESSAFEGKTKFRVDVTLDLLYMTILREAFGNDDPEGDSKVRSVLGAVILAMNPLPPSTIAALLGLDPEDVLPLLLSMCSFLVLKEGVDNPVRPFHKSFPDFIVDPSRCTDPRFSVCPPDQHMELLVGCLSLMNQKLEQNMCRLPDGARNSDVNDLKERSKEYIGQALEYACRSWHKHLLDTAPAHRPKIISVLHQFLEEKFLFWLEVLSVLGVAREAVDALQAVEKWLDVSPTLDLTRDCLHFLVAFFEVISTSTPHIYHSALPLFPQTSTVHKLYKSYASPLVRVVQGVSIVQEQFVASKSHSDHICGMTWSPSNKLIAVAWSSSQKTAILDATTLKQLNTFESCRHGFRHPWLGFSQEGHFLAEFDRKNIMSWDLQTGGEVSSFNTGLYLTSNFEFSSAYSMDGKMLAVVFWNWNGLFPTVIISIYNILSQERVCSHTLQGSVVSVWSQGVCFRVAARGLGFLTVWEVGFSPFPSPVEVGKYPIPYEIESAREILFLPTVTRLAFTLVGKVLIWDIQGSRALLDLMGEEMEMISFSPNGNFFACVCGQELHVWKDSPTGYVLHQNVLWDIRRYLFSPDGESIIISDDKSLHLLSTRDPIPSPSDAQTQSIDWSPFILEFSPDERSAAIARKKENTVTILELKSGNPQLIVNAGIEIYGLRVTRAAIIIVGEGVIITWNLPVGDCATTAYAYPKDSVQTIMFNYSGYYSSALISPDLKHIAILSHFTLSIYDTSTGKHLTSIEQGFGLRPYFSPDGHELWCVDGNSMSGWKIIGDGGSSVFQLEPLEPTVSPSGVFSWQSSQGYEITPDGWVLDSTHKQLLWLPHHWRSHEKHIIWGGQFLGLLHGALKQAVILEFPM
ncbi:hypothetical protein BJ322DRAFT_1210848 [Thelephora terrestris]|uniref:NACHT domain-containing protein n=1 Tax=Thelephora terrestris TaxID=56493 RepID=A0A9P6HG25_9AGAM|nr:hypothetical protein BJ322DRAFT_1210848 [Thelephora terrestris]